MFAAPNLITIIKVVLQKDPYYLKEKIRHCAIIQPHVLVCMYYTYTCGCNGCKM